MKKVVLITLSLIALAIVFDAITKAVETENKFSHNGPDFFNPEYRYSWDRVG